MTTAPNVFINPQMPVQGGRKPGFNLKYIFIILAVVIVAEVIFGLKSFLSPAKNAAPVNVSSQPTAPIVKTTVSSKSEVSGKMTLNSPQKGYKVGDTIIVSISLDTSGKSADGVDAVLHFDPKILDASASSITKGALFPDYPVTKISPDGTVRITALSSLQGQGYAGIGVLATINFKSKTAGNPKISWDFTPGATNDSNIFASGVGDDMLKTVGGLEVLVK